MYEDTTGGETHDKHCVCPMCTHLKGIPDTFETVFDQYSRIFMVFGKTYVKEMLDDPKELQDIPYHAQECYNRMVEMWLEYRYGMVPDGKGWFTYPKDFKQIKWISELP